MLPESHSNPSEQRGTPADTMAIPPFGSPCVPLHRFSFSSPRLGWGFLETYHGLPEWGMRGWTDWYLILWDGAAHDDEWFAEARHKIVWAYDNWEAPHYGDAVILHKIHLEPGVPPQERKGSEVEAIRLALGHLRNPIPVSAPAKPWFRHFPLVNYLLRSRIPAPEPVSAWLSVQCQERVDECVCEAYQALFLESDGESDLLRSASLLRLWEERFDPPESLRLDRLELEGWQDCCVEVSVPRDAFRKAYYEAVFGLGDSLL